MSAQYTSSRKTSSRGRSNDPTAVPLPPGAAPSAFARHASSPSVERPKAPSIRSNESGFRRSKIYPALAEPPQMHIIASSKPMPTRTASAPTPPGLSEAKAYALAVAPALVKRVSEESKTRRLSRPLPQPPISPPKMEIIASSRPKKFTIDPSPPEPRIPRANLPARKSSIANQVHSRRPRRTRATFPLILSQIPIQSCLLSYLTINSFLSLTGSSQAVRKQFSGETIGRWVFREWGLFVEKEKGRSWPNLTVWEGFLESLLHDPSTYGTYTPQWHGLLQHLCLSHSLIVLHMRSLPSSSYPSITPLPFDDEAAVQLRPSSSFTSLASMQQGAPRPMSRVGSIAGSEMSRKMPRRERLVEIVMPAPLADPAVEMITPQRRDSVSSTSLFGRKRSNSLVPGTLPPVSFPTPKRYGFSQKSTRSRAMSESGRPRSIFSVQSSVTQARSRRPSVYEVLPPVPLPLAQLQRMSISRSATPSDVGSSPQVGWDINRTEPAFERPPPYIPGRAPILRVFVPLSEKVRRWPSAEAAQACLQELDKCGATRRLALGDLIVNTAIHQPKTTEHVLIYVPFVKHLLVPLEYRYSPNGTLPSYIDGFQVSPTYYHPFLPTPHILHLDLRPFARAPVRLAYDRRDVTVASGARMTAKRYLYVAGFEILPEHKTQWQGMVSLEADGTAEGKAALEAELRKGGLSGPWEMVMEKCMTGSIWLKLR